MKIYYTIIACILSLTASAQTDNPKYDAVLAQKLGADDFGMKKYVLVILKTGTATITDKEKVNELFRGHMDNISRLAKEGKLVVAGPFMKNEKNYRGIFIFNVKSLDEAQALLETDPAVKEKLLQAEMLEWYGSAALSEYLSFHEKIERKKP